MSNRITILCRPLPMKPAQKAVLMCLADRANDDGLAWPSVPGICEWTCLGRTAVIEAVRAIEGLGFLTVSRLNGKTNRATFDLARLEQANQSASRTGTPPGRVRQTDPTSPPRGLLPVRQADGTSPPRGPEASVHQGCTTEAPHPGGVPSAARPDGRGGEDLHGEDLLAEVVRTRVRPLKADEERQLREDVAGSPGSAERRLRRMLGQTHWMRLPSETEVVPARRASRSVNDKWREQGHGCKVA